MTLFNKRQSKRWAKLSLGNTIDESAKYLGRLSILRMKMLCLTTSLVPTTGQMKIIPLCASASSLCNKTPTITKPNCISTTKTNTNATASASLTKWKLFGLPTKKSRELRISRLTPWTGTHYYKIYSLMSCLKMQPKIKMRVSPWSMCPSQQSNSQLIATTHSWAISFRFWSFCNISYQFIISCSRLWGNVNHVRVSLWKSWAWMTRLIGWVGSCTTPWSILWWHLLQRSFFASMWLDMTAFYGLGSWLQRMANLSLDKLFSLNQSSRKAKMQALSQHFSTLSVL